MMFTTINILKILDICPHLGFFPKGALLRGHTQDTVKTLEAFFAGGESEQLVRLSE